MVHSSLVRKELRQMRWKLVFGLALLTVLVSSYAFMHDMLAGLIKQELSDPLSLPFGLGEEILESLDNYTYAAYSNWNRKNLLQIGTILAIVLGMPLLAAEYEHDTLSFLLSLGLRREDVYWSKVVAGLTALFTLVAIPLLFFFPATQLAGQTLEHLRIVGASLVTYSGLAFIFSVSIWFSARTKDSIKAGLLTVLVAIFLAFLGAIPGLSQFAPYYLMSAVSYFLGLTGFPWLVVLAFVALTGFVLWSAYRHFMTVDI